MVNQISCDSNQSNSTIQQLTSDAVIEVLGKVFFACSAVFYHDFIIVDGHMCTKISILNSFVFHSRLASIFLLHLEQFQLKQ